MRYGKQPVQERDWSFLNLLVVFGQMQEKRSLSQTS
jgi:hypothetical protein